MYCESCLVLRVLGLVVFQGMSTVCVAKESIQVVGLCYGIGVEYCDSSVSSTATILEFASLPGGAELVEL